MIAYQKFLALALLTSLLLIHCGGGGSSSTTQIPPSPPVARAVYAVGDANPGSGINHIAANVVWKNGAVLWALPTNTDVWSVAVNGGDVYVAGSLYNPNTYTSTYTIWKNGVANTALSPIPNLYIPAIATSGN